MRKLLLILLSIPLVALGQTSTEIPWPTEVATDYDFEIVNQVYYPITGGDFDGDGARDLFIKYTKDNSDYYFGVYSYSKKQFIAVIKSDYNTALKTIEDLNNDNAVELVLIIRSSVPYKSQIYSYSSTGVKKNTNNP